ncbi:MFS transporter [Exilibacterium tricleocarpae]|uniref:MFS transporter n=2 Tax=Exilibacterium tricleocarpae TaxID=2591008 RepID=A0A545T2C2_9GAMM|nr:MFS transporter [Exilibacterium tricleocarpae]
MLGLFMVLPVLALYGTDYAGSTPLLLGLALGAYGFSQALLQIPFGMLSDRLGRKPMIALGLLLFALGSVVAATAESVYGLIIGRCLQGGGAIASVIMALVADLTSEQNRTKAMAAIGASIGLSFSVALVLGPVITGIAGLSGIFWFTAVFALLGLVVLFKLIPDPGSAETAQREAGAVAALLGQTLKHRDLLRLDWGIFCLHFVLMASFVVVPVMLEADLGLARERHWQVYLPLLTLAFVAMVPFMLLAERHRKIKTVFLGAIALLAAMLVALIWWQRDLVLALTALFLFFMAFNLLEATLPSLMSKVAPAGTKGTAAGIYSTSQFLGAFAGGAGGGALMQFGGPHWVFGCGAAVVVSWLAVAAFMRPPRFLTSVWVPLGDADLTAMKSRMLGLSGVEEVVIIEDERAAYLKVDNRLFDRSSVDQLQQ